MKRGSVNLTLAAAATALLAGLAPRAAEGAAPPPDKVALTGGRIITMAGPEIENGTVLIEHGKITAVGTDVEIPYDATEIDVSGKVVMPGMIDAHSSRGLDIANEPLPVTPFLDVYDAIDPSQLYFEDALRDGLTSIHIIPGNDTVIGGVSRVLRPIGLTPDEMTVRPDVALKLATSPKRGYDRMRQMATLRETFRKLDRSIELLAEKKYEERQSEREKNVNVGPQEAREQGRELIKDGDYEKADLNLVRLRRGDLLAFIACENATDVGPAVNLATAEGFLNSSVLVIGSEAHKAIGELKSAGRPVIVGPDLYHRERDPYTGEIEETFVPRKLRDAGLSFSLLPSGDPSMGERYLNYQAAVCVREGIPRDEALRAITLAPAQAIGLGDSLGSLEAGKTANIVVMSGDPLDFNAWVDLVYIDGIQAYDRQQDPRLQELLNLEARAREAAEDEAADETPDAGAASDDAEQSDDAGDADSTPDSSGEGETDSDGAGE